ncbi:glycosyltransferase family 2 protein [Dyadobacter sp. CY323]|uniref:glycosyltransferase family 2 protein n=1 Tax=Dyadobacter sp. CY323 TaxID=2907302 RepID=UPI001F205B60|nr:glycosyltransferase family 2 protein [Dyadobacter sp. CY323]MCE6987782.1 glycosyltransferase family 2 protein [Dyadobacter sp. CY323]
MESKPLISIALCTYNGRDFLEEQLNSVLSQSMQDWEMVIVDDCSRDDTRSILNAYVARDHRFKVHFNDKNLGYNKNFEKALRLCEGEFIAICDQDDIWDKDKLQIQLEAIKENLLVYHDSAFIDQAGKSMGTKISDKFEFYRGDRPEAFLYFNCVSGHSIFMKRSLLRNALPFPIDFHYDQWLAYIATSHGSVDFVDQCLVHYRQHKKNNTDILAIRPTVKSTGQKIDQLKKESEWLKLCAEHASETSAPLITRLYELSLRRNASFMSIAYGREIWKNRKYLLRLLKKSEISKFFFTLRKIWGPLAKTVL